MREKAFTFGDGATMVAIVTEPSRTAEAKAARGPAVIILNSGIVHRIGPARNSVAIARRLAQDGFLVMRFDLSGIGDSASRRDGHGFGDNAVLDVEQAMDHLERQRGIREFVLIGLCSGADFSFAAARADHRVVGAVLIDGYGYRTPEYYVRYYGRRVLRAQVWLNLGARSLARLRRVLKAPQAPATPPRVPEWSREFPPRASFATNLQALIARGVSLYFIYTGEMEQYYNYRGQLADAFPALELERHTTVDFFAEADHTFSELKLRRLFAEAIARWMARRFTVSAGHASAA